MTAAGMIESNRQWVVDWSGLYVGPVGDRRPPLVHIQASVPRSCVAKKTITFAYKQDSSCIGLVCEALIANPSKVLITSALMHIKEIGRHYSY